MEICPPSPSTIDDSSNSRIGISASISALTSWVDKEVCLLFALVRFVEGCDGGSHGRFSKIGIAASYISTLITAAVVVDIVVVLPFLFLLFRFLVAFIVFSIGLFRFRLVTRRFLFVGFVFLPFTTLNSTPFLPILLPFLRFRVSIRFFLSLALFVSISFRLFRLPSAKIPFYQIASPTSIHETFRPTPIQTAQAPAFLSFLPRLGSFLPLAVFSFFSSSLPISQSASPTGVHEAFPPTEFTQTHPPVNAAVAIEDITTGI
mmetsp:Transcript_841/g.1697  ORF Transcript_841/g.1697 Transcript_841/m.1697 type:complete len:261 (+) Transcript_841:901-1683(+)